jgi:hypothetical protein
MLFGTACTSSSVGPSPSTSAPISPPPKTSPTGPSSTGDSPSVSTTPESTTPESTTPGSSTPDTGIDSGPPGPPQPSLPSDVPTTGPNTRPGEKPPIMPLEATQHTARGARAFAAFFIKTIDWGYATTSSTYMRHYYFAKTCTECRSVAFQLDAVQQKDHHFVGDRFDIRRTTLAHIRRDGVTATLSVYFDVGRGAVLTKHGERVDLFKPLTNYREDLYLQWRRTPSGDAWVVGVMVPRA